MDRRAAWPLGKYLVSLVLFGTNGIVASFIVLSPGDIILYRTLLGSALLVGVLAATRGMRAVRRHGRAQECGRARDRVTSLSTGPGVQFRDTCHDVSRETSKRTRGDGFPRLCTCARALAGVPLRDLVFVGASGVAMGVSWLFQYEAYRAIGVGLTSLIYCCGPVLLVAAGPLLFRERLRGTMVACLMAVVAGAALVNVPVLSGTAAAADTGCASAWGLACAGGMALCYALMIVLNKRSRRLAGLPNATVQLVTACATAAAFAIASGGGIPAVPAGSVGPLLLLGLVNTGIGCFLYFSSIGTLPARTVAVCDFLEPLSALVLAAIVLGETLVPLQAVGAVLIVAGAACCCAGSRGRRGAKRRARCPETRWGAGPSRGGTAR